MVREIFKVIFCFLVFSLSLANAEFIDVLKMDGFNCQDDQCTKNKGGDIFYVFNEESVNMRAATSDSAKINSSCDIVFDYFLDEYESRDAKLLLAARANDHNDFLDKNLVFYSKTMNDFYVSVGVFDGLKEKHVVCYLSKQ